MTHPLHSLHVPRLWNTRAHAPAAGLWSKVHAPRLGRRESNGALGVDDASACVCRRAQRTEAQAMARDNDNDNDRALTVDPTPYPCVHMQRVCLRVRADTQQRGQVLPAALGRSRPGLCGGSGCDQRGRVDLPRRPQRSVTDPPQRVSPTGARLPPRRRAPLAIVAESTLPNHRR